MIKIAAVVILYYPDRKTVQNILSYSSFVEAIYAIDNSENPNEEFINEIERVKNCRYFRKNVNEGIARRLNEACELAKAEGYEWLLTMDQDSYFREADLINYINCFSLYEEKEKTAVFGVEYIDSTLESSTCKAVEVEQIITSGSIVNLALFNAIGKFDEALFIDEVDLDYCYQSIIKGFKIVQFTNVFLNHTLGQISWHTSLKSLRSTRRTLHSPTRVYYMVRNFLYVDNKYKNNFKADKKRRKAALLNRIKNNILYGKKRFLILRLILKAYRDYRRNKMGRIS